MNYQFLKLFHFILFASATFSLYGQRLLLIETINDPVNIKIMEGQQLEYKVIGDNEWRKDKISKIIISDTVIVFESGYHKIREISHVRQYRPMANIISKTLMTFGSGWLAYGAIGSATGQFEFGADTVIIGSGSLGIGWAMYKLFYKRKLAIGSRYRLRLIDVSL